MWSEGSLVPFWNVFSVAKSVHLQYVSSVYRDADKSLAQPTSQCILFDGENILFDASLVIYIYIKVKVTSTTGRKGPRGFWVG
jgi:hypothetical protein